MRVVRCPQCGAQVEWEKSPHRPFCSERCRLVDLGTWLNGGYVIPGEPADVSAREDADREAPAFEDDEES